MWLRKALGYQDPAPASTALDTMATNPVGWSSMAVPQVLTNPSPYVSPLVEPSALTPQQRIGRMLTGGPQQPTTEVQLGDLAARGQQAMDNALTVAGATQPVGIRAYHGSPHTFDRFSMDRIGTGEGAQAYGHGLYFAGNEGVARGYREGLSGIDLRLGGKPWREIPMPPEAAKYYHWKTTPGVDPSLHPSARDYIGRLERWADEAEKMAKNPGRTPLWRGEADDLLRTAAEQRKAAEWFRANAALEETVAPTGSMYEVNLRTSPERLLDWDKPLSAPNNKALLRALEDTGKPVMPEDNASGGYWTLSERLRPRGASDVAGVTAANDTLRNSGLDGIQYLDAGSRAAGEGSRNYVIFDDKLIDILRRYGLFGLSTAMGGAAATAGAEQ